MRRYCRSRGIRFADETYSYEQYLKTADGRNLDAVLKKIQANAEIAENAARKAFDIAYANDRLIEQYLRMLDSAVDKGLDEKIASRIESRIRNAKQRGKSAIAELHDFIQFYNVMLH